MEMTQKDKQIALYLLEQKYTQEAVARLFNISQSKLSRDLKEFKQLHSMIELLPEVCVLDTRLKCCNCGTPQNLQIKMEITSKIM